MFRRITTFALATFLLAPAALAAQTGEALIQKLGASPPTANPTFPAARDVEYKVAWDVNKGPETPGALVEGFRLHANFLVLADQEQVPRKNVHLAIIVYGTAAQSLLARDAYKAATGAENESIPLLEALNAAGVKVIVCGVALINRKIPREGLLPFVQVATSATMARATLHAQGYATFGQ